jgi:hypothetical protein
MYKMPDAVPQQAVSQPQPAQPRTAAPIDIADSGFMFAFEQSHHGETTK